MVELATKRLIFFGGMMRERETEREFCKMLRWNGGEYFWVVLDNLHLSKSPSEKKFAFVIFSLDQIE